MDKTNLYHLTPLQYFKRQLLSYFFKKITRRSLNIFFRGGDLISEGPQIFGVWEPTLTNYINACAENGSSDFLIDIGANIGLSSCQNGNRFKKIYCFEPNPLCVNILKTNLAISLNEGAFEIFDFALGNEDGEVYLYIPKHNWGGAFIRSTNDYADDVLGKKDGFESINENNYLIKTVKMKNSEAAFKNLFSSLIASNLTNGVIKIDVEGFERKVLLAIAKTIPSSLNVTIVFENWDPMFDLKEIQNSFKDRTVRRFKFERSIVGTNKSKFRKYLEFLFFGEKTILVNYDADKVLIGDIILRID